jgi:hypothetical protein
MRLNEQITEAEYVSKKHGLVNRQAELKGKLTELERSRNERFEPDTRFVLDAKQAVILLADGNPDKKRDFLKKIGSNFQLADKSLTVEFKIPWNYLADFNSDPTTISARQRGKPLESNWRREGDSNSR